MSAESKRATLELVMWVAAGKPAESKPAWIALAEKVCPERLPEIMAEAEAVVAREAAVLGNLPTVELRTAMLGLRTVVGLADVT